MRIGVMGAKGSFSEEAAKMYTKDNGIKTYEIKYLISAEPLLKNLTSSAIDLGIMPIENSTGGMVVEAVYAMSKYVFSIQDMFGMDIRHFLLAYGGQSKEEINQIVSHPQALKQCHNYLRNNWGKVEVNEWEDTAKAAKDLANGVLDNKTAIIAPRGCADLYGLEILDTNIQDLKYNVTTFLAVTKK